MRSVIALPVWLLCMLLPSAAASDRVVEDSHRGYWNSLAGAYCPNVPFSGSGPAGGTCRSAFVFDLSDVDQPVGSAILSLEVFRYWSSAESECFLVHEVITDPARIIAGEASLDIFDDLGAGVHYSDEVCGSRSDVGRSIDVPLGPAGVAAVNAAQGGSLVLGVRLTTLDGTPGPYGEALWFDGSEAGRNEVILGGPLPIAVEIRPWNGPSSIRLVARGLLQVAVLGSATFEVLEVDVTTLTFGPAQARPFHNRGGTLRDVNRDGFSDLVSHYRIRETGLTTESLEACVRGQTVEGVPFEGCDPSRFAGAP